MNILIFLGNPGKQYKKTRHNLPWIVLENLSFYSSLNWTKKFKSEMAKIEEKEFIIIKPLTYMNKSGEAVLAAMSYFKTKPENLIVVHDDLELPYGVAQIKKGGGAGGHNGIRSIIKLTGSSNFSRLRLGVSRPPAGRDVASWVLNKFSIDEEAELDNYCKKAALQLEAIIFDNKKNK